MKPKKFNPTISGRDENEKLILLMKPPQAWPKSVKVSNKYSQKKKKKSLEHMIGKRHVNQQKIDNLFLFFYYAYKKFIIDHLLALIRNRLQS